MTEVPKIVYDRLRAARPEGALHPDADLLTAFAEQALSATERDGMLEHLALCGDCRDVVALALPKADMGAGPAAADIEAEATASPAKPRWNWLSSASLARPGLRWAALAAGVAVAAAVLLLHPGKLNQATLPSANRQVATPALPASGAQIASAPVASGPVASSPIEPSTTLTMTDAMTDETRVTAKLRMSRKLKAGQAASPLPPQSGMLLAENKKGAGLPDKPPAVPSVAAGAFDNNPAPSRIVTESVEVAAAAEAVVVEPSSQGGTQGTLMARDAAPAIEKAKPAPQETEVIGQQKTEAAFGAASARVQNRNRNMMSAAKLAPSPNQTLADQTLAEPTLAEPTANVTWTIKAGVLRRSLDSGQSWLDALHAEHPLLCYAGHGADIWTGGQAGALFHSPDNGVTWMQVQPSVKAHTLSSDVTRIDIHDNQRGPVEIIVSTSNNEIWTSADGGKIWHKK